MFLHPGRMSEKGEISAEVLHGSRVQQVVSWPGTGQNASRRLLTVETGKQKLTISSYSEGSGIDRERK